MYSIQIRQPPFILTKVRGDTMETTYLELINVSKSFPGARVLTDINISVTAGQVVSIVGENGAGKSTLGNIISGSLKPDSGTIRFLGEDYTHLTIEKAKELGISMVHQELMVLPKMTASANIFVGNELHNGTFLKTKDMDVMVTGTEFNVKAYSDEMNVQTTLLQGVVTVFSGFEKKEKMEIKPNQQAEWCRRSVKMRVREVDPDLFMAWKNGRFIFRQDRLEDIMRTLARWYGVEVVYLDESVKSMLFAGKLERSEEITPILDVLRTTDKLSVDVKGKKIVIGLK